MTVPPSKNGPKPHQQPELEIQATHKLSETIEPLVLVADGMVHVPEAAQFLGIGKSLLYQMMDQGEVPFAKFHGRRCIPRRALVELAASRLVLRKRQ